MTELSQSRFAAMRQEIQDHGRVPDFLNTTKEDRDKALQDKKGIEALGSAIATEMHMQHTLQNCQKVEDVLRGRVGAMIKHNHPDDREHVRGVYDFIANTLSVEPQYSGGFSRDQIFRGILEYALRTISVPDVVDEMRAAFNPDQPLSLAYMDMLQVIERHVQKDGHNKNIDTSYASFVEVFDITLETMVNKLKSG